MFLNLFFFIILFLLGICGVFLSRKNILIIIMSLEIMLLSVNLILVLFSTYLDDLLGILFTIFILSVGASETAIGLALVVAYYQGYSTF